MKRLLLAPIVVAVVLVAFTATASATDEDSFWAQTTISRARTDFTIEHRPGWTTTGTIQITQTLRSSKFVGVEVSEEVTLDATLLHCPGEKECRKVWIVRAAQRVESLTPSPVTIRGTDSASLVAELPATVSVLDFEDSDRDGDFSEQVGTFETAVQIKANWHGEKAASSVNCGKDGEDKYLLKNELAEALPSGSISDYSFTTASAEMSRSVSSKEHHKDPWGCAA